MSIVILKLDDQIRVNAVANFENLFWSFRHMQIMSKPIPTRILESFEDAAVYSTAEIAAYKAYQLLESADIDANIRLLKVETKWEDLIQSAKSEAGEEISSLIQCKDGRWLYDEQFLKNLLSRG